MNAIPIRPGYLALALIAVPFLAFATCMVPLIALTVLGNVVTAVVRSVLGA
jgi:hypothetical protein